MEASQRYRAGNSDKTLEAITLLQKHKRAIKQTSARAGLRKQKKEDVPANAIILPDGKWFTIVDPIVDNLGETDKNRPWIYHYRKESRELAIVINAASITYLNLVKKQTHDSTMVVLVLWAISDAMLQLLNKEFQYALSEAIPIRDEQLNWLTAEEGRKDD